MIELILGLAVLVVLAGLALLLPAVVRRHRSTRPQSHHLWAVAQANTADGVTARLSVDFVAEIDETLDTNAVVDLVEALIRDQISISAAHQLPSIGDSLLALDDDTPAGAKIERAVVASSEIEVTPELRRLITAGD